MTRNPQMRCPQCRQPAVQQVPAHLQGVASWAGKGAAPLRWTHQSDASLLCLRQRADGAWEPAQPQDRTIGPRSAAAAHQAAAAIRQVPGQLREVARDLTWAIWNTRAPDGRWTARRWTCALNYLPHPRLTANQEMCEQTWDDPLDHAAFTELQETRQEQDLAAYPSQPFEIEQRETSHPSADTEAKRPAPCRNVDVHDTSWEAGQ